MWSHINNVWNYQFNNKLKSLIFTPERQKTGFHLNSSSIHETLQKCQSWSSSLLQMSWSCFMCVMDVSLSVPPPPIQWEMKEGITCHLLITLLQSGNKAAASALFHFLCGRKLSRHTADGRRAYPGLHLSGFIEVEAACQSRSSTCSRRGRWGKGGGPRDTACCRSTERSPVRAWNHDISLLSHNISLQFQIDFNIWYWNQTIYSIKAVSDSESDYTTAAFMTS